MIERSNINLYLGDSLEAMKSMPDNAYDLAIVDPPYGVEEITGKEFSHGRGKLKDRAFNRGSVKVNDWDKAPTKNYFNELFRVSKNQIIWGANYFDLPPYRCIVVWDKMQPFPNFSAIEIAYTSFNQPAKLFKFYNRYSGKIHPMQKPIALYKWLLTNYAKEGDKILDTHGGSMSIAIACHDLKFDLDLWELDPDYYEAGVKRFEEHKKQLQLF